MKLKKLLKICDKNTYISVLDLSNSVRSNVCTIEEFIDLYDKEVLKRKISFIEFDQAIVRIDIF